MSTAPLTIDDFLELLRQTTPPEYHLPIIDDPRGSIALYRAFCKGMAVTGARANEMAQRAFFLPSSLQTSPPATSGARATFTARIGRQFGLDQGRVVIAGKMEIEGPQGRRYRNRSEVVWAPFDDETIKDVEFEAVEIGAFYNLTHLADEDGLITKPLTDPPEPWLERVNFRRLSLDRTGTNGSVVQASSVDGSSAVYDSGVPDRLAGSDVGLYLRIDDATQADNLGRILRIVGFEDPGVEDPPDSGLRPRLVLVDDGPQRFRLTSAQADDGGSLTDETAAANESTDDDMTLLPAAPVVNDAYYFGAQVPFRELTVEVSQQGEGTWTVVWEYWDSGGSWVEMPGAEDGTEGLSRSGTASWLAPAGWASTVVNGVGAYYVRARVSSFTSITTQPLGRLAYAGIQQQLVTEDDTITWAVLDFVDLGFEIVELEAPTGGEDNILRILGEERGVYQQAGESDDAFRQRASRLPDTVSPNAINRVVNRILAEYGAWGRARDVGGPVLSSLRRPYMGTFYDVPVTSAPEVVSVFDMYGGGDTYPEDTTMLQLSLEEARWHFFVEVPRLMNGDWGPFYDSSVLLTTSDGINIDSAFDHAFYDGYPVVAYQIYSRIHNAVDTIREGGIGFTIVYGEFDPCP